MHRLVSGFLSDSEDLGRSRSHIGWPDATTPHRYPTPSCSSVFSARSGIPSEKKRGSRGDGGGVLLSPLGCFCLFQPTSPSVFISFCLSCCSCSLQPSSSTSIKAPCLMGCLSSRTYFQENLGMSSNLPPTIPFTCFL